MKRLNYKKIKRKIWAKIVALSRNKKWYPIIYRSYWHSVVFTKDIDYDNKNFYYSARPNPGAGIGHQIANWIAGYWFAKQFGLKFAHIPFSTPMWDNFLGFGLNEKTFESLKQEGYKVRTLPQFKENNKDEVELNKRIIRSYSGQKVVFIAEQDQFYKDQYGVINELQNKFYSAPCRSTEKLIYSPNNFNIAIHVRRGDIMLDPTNPNLVMRYLSNDYFEKVLTEVINNLKTDKPIHIYFFSQGNSSDYPEFFKFKNLHWCLDMNAQRSFSHFVYADLLITSKSSFSYKPALLNKGVKVCPRVFWHGYPDDNKWILCDNEGTFNSDDLSKLVL